MPISASTVLGEGVVIHHKELVNLYGCSVGDETTIGAFVEIQKSASIGRRCKISSHSFICEGVTIEDGVFIGHGVTFTNDRFPRAVTGSGSLKRESDWILQPTTVREGATIGSGATLLPGIVVGRWAMIGAGTVVIDDVPDFALVVGVPGRVIGAVAQDGQPERAQGAQPR
jgi:UDP-2-acetamido-3-amino-2,3-dideoxy-glucuronate N-acetyltransferase